MTDLSATERVASSPEITLSSDGTKATAVWRLHDGSNNIIQSKSATIIGNAATWVSTSTDLTATGQSATSPEITLSSDGTKATAVWHRHDGSNWIIQSKSATIIGNAATWGAVTDLTATGQDATSLQITLSSDGTKATAVWRRRRSDGSSRIIQSKSATIIGNAATWGSVNDLSAAGQDAYSTKIGLSSDGTKATAVWYRDDGSNEIIQSASATIIGNTATWGSVTDLSATGQDAEAPQITLSSDGTKAMAVWYLYDGPNAIVQSASTTISENAATWGAVTDLSANGQNAYDPQIGLSSDGTKATAVWYRSNGSNNIIQSKSAVLEGCSYYVIKSINDKTAVICL